MKLLVLGAGGIGGYFGGRLAETGTDVTFLVRPRRRQQLERDGLRIESPRGSVALPVQTVLAADVRAEYDFVLLTCKAYDLDSAMDAIAPAMNGRCAVVPLLNGMAHLEALDRRFGAESVMGGNASILVTLGADGVIRHGDPLQRISFGERDRAKSERSQLFAKAFVATSLEWDLSDDIMRSMWEKIVFLSVLASANCLYRASTGEIVRAPGGLHALEHAMAVNVDVATREGYAPRASIVEFFQQTLTDPTSERKGSMIHDLEAGAPVEADHVVGWMLGRAKAHGLEHPLLEHAYTALKAYEARRAATLAR
jgi:2-dehydropantoate 2-reductase